MNKIFKARTLRPGFLILVSLLSGMPGFSQNSQADYKRNENGLKYRFYKTGANPNKAVPGDVVTLVMVYKTMKDSVIFDSRNNDYDFIYSVTTPVFKGDFNEALCMMTKGDSATFILKSDSFFLKTLGSKTLPEGIRKGSELKFDIMMKNLKSNSEYINEQMAMIKKDEEGKAKLRQQEKDSLEKYLKVHMITAKPTDDGLYFISIREGQGAQAAIGKTVLVEYKGTLLNGTLFETTENTGRPAEIKLGSSKVIRGLNEGIAMMKAGGKAILIIPSDLAYHDNAIYPVPPYATLVYEIELVEVK